MDLLYIQHERGGTGVPVYQRKHQYVGVVEVFGEGVGTF